MNYFSPDDAAERYSKGRPDFHAGTIERVNKFLCLEKKLDSALDIACGTGLSTRPLLKIAKEVHGTDSSAPMLSHALEPEKIKYSVANAEDQPFENNTFDLITVCSGIHWFNIGKFLKEAQRLLKSGGWLVLYDNFFISEMAGNEAFTSWYPEVYLKKYPAPLRNEGYDWSDENLGKMNFKLVNEESFKNAVIFTKKQLILYFTTQSNIISKVVANETTYDEAEKWLEQELSRLFDAEDAVRTIYFGNWVKYIQRVK
jgi:ubiquinone/menaquinone biosynthesis C-methylase UbiE